MSIYNENILTCIIFSLQILHLQAVERALDELCPPLDKDKPSDSLHPWLNDVRVSQNVVLSIISLPSQSSIRMESRYNRG